MFQSTMKKAIIFAVLPVLMATSVTFAAAATIPGTSLPAASKTGTTTSDFNKAKANGLKRGAASIKPKTGTTKSGVVKPGASTVRPATGSKSTTSPRNIVKPRTKSSGVKTTPVNNASGVKKSQ